ncbi:hypothetical protein MAR_025116, partial [Mya arenaria]
MGAASSNNIKSIKLDQKNSFDKNTLASNKANQGILADKLCESESQRLDLEDRVQALEEQLEKQQAQDIEHQERPCDETLHAKDQYIVKLEQENKELKAEAQKMRGRHRRKVKQMSSQMAEYKQEANFQMMELQEEIEQLKKDNKQKLPQLKDSQSGNVNTTKVDEGVSLPGGEKMALILELSQQVAEQQDRIASLEGKLEDRDRVVEELRTKMKNNSQYLKAVNSARDGATESAIGDLRKTTSLKYKVKPAGKEQSSTNTNKRFSDADRIDALFSHGEDDDSDTGSMAKLSSLLRGVKAPANKTKVNQESDDDEIGNRQNQIQESDPNNGGRDSGLGSAGKRDEATNNVSRPSLADWKDHVHSFESGSGLSDSDFDNHPHIGSKVSSAPPKLQNRDNKKLKKKSNSLKKHVSGYGEVIDKPPRPSLAFMSSLHEEDSESLLHGIKPLSHISPVQVSLDVSQGVHEDYNKLSDSLQPSCAQVQDTVVGVEIEGVAVGIVPKPLIGRDLISQQQGDRGMLAVSGHQFGDKTSKLVHDKLAGIKPVQVHSGLAISRATSSASFRGAAMLYEAGSSGWVVGRSSSTVDGRKDSAGEEGLSRDSRRALAVSMFRASFK